jgi:acetolactate synthase-1/2/3 large subunit
LSETLHEVRATVSSVPASVYQSVLDGYRTVDGEPDRIRCAELLGGGTARARQRAREALASHAPNLADVDRLAREVVGDVQSWPLQLSGAEVVAAVLKAHGVKTMFTYAGTSELALCDAFADTVGLELVNGRGDRESAFMAAGASFLVPNQGAALLHGARGLTNAAGALADIRRYEIGVVFVVGLPSTSSAAFMPPHGERDLIARLSDFAGYAWECPEVPAAPAERAELASAFVTQLRKALETAAQPPFHPSLFGVPQDVAEECWIGLSALTDGWSAPSPGPRGSTPAGRSDPQIDGVVAALQAATRPLILVDDFALRHEGARQALSDLSRACGAAIAQLRYRRGPMLFERLQPHEVDNFVGWLNPYSAVHAKMLADADLLITVEDRNMYRRLTGELPACRKIAINSNPAMVRKNGYLGPGDLLVEGHPVEIMTRVAARANVVVGQRPQWFAPAAGLVSGVTPDPPSERVRYGRRAVAAELARALRGWARPVVVDDSQMFGGLLSDSYDDFPAGLRVFGGHGGFVGCGMPYAVGLAVSEPTVRVMCTLGDQGFTNAYQALVAAHQQRARVLFVVCNNGESVSLQKQAVSRLGERRRAYLDNVAGLSYADIARAHGTAVRQLRVPIGAAADAVDATMVEMAGMLAELTSVDGPSLLELLLPSDPEAWRGIWLANGFDELAPDQTGAVAHPETR